MSIQPIKIQIENKRHYRLAVFFVDRDDFLEDIARARQELKLSDLPYKVTPPPFKKAKYYLKLYEKGQLTIDNLRTLLIDLCNKKKVALDNYDKTLYLAGNAARKLQIKYNKDISYFPLILASILIGKANDFDFPFTQVIDLQPEDFSEETRKELNINTEMTLIVVDRETTWDDIEDRFKFIQKYSFNEDEIIKHNIKDAFRHKTRGVDNTERDRSWYWQHKNELSYDDIRKKALVEEGISITRGGVIEAIQAYERKLDVKV